MRPTRLGYHHLTCSEHVAVPAAVAKRRGSRYYDPLATFGYLAARTSTDPVRTTCSCSATTTRWRIAKRYGTLDRVSGGRLVLGVGVGSLERSSTRSAADFEGGDRGAHAIRALARVTVRKLEPAYSARRTTRIWLRDRPGAVQPHVADLDRRPHATVPVARRRASPTAGAFGLSRADGRHDRPTRAPRHGSARGGAADAPPSSSPPERAPFDPAPSPTGFAVGRTAGRRGSDDAQRPRRTPPQHYLEQLAVAASWSRRPPPARCVVG